MIHVSENKKAIAVTMDILSAYDLIAMQKAIINLVKSYDGDSTDGNVLYALNLLEELLPDEEMFEKALNPERNLKRDLNTEFHEMSYVVFPEHLTGNQRLAIKYAVEPKSPKMKRNPIVNALQEIIEDKGLFGPENLIA